jgi:hypothetical protein
LPAHTWELRLGIGVTTGRSGDFGTPLFSTEATRDDPLKRELDALGSITYAITDRLSWSVPLPAFAYRFGDEGEWTTTVRGGLTAFGYTNLEGAIGSVDAGIGARAWLSPSVSMIANGSSDWAFGSPDRERVLQLRGSLGIAWAVSDRVTVALGAGYGGGIALHDDPVPGDLVLGAVQSLGYRPLPLLQLYVTDWFSIDAYASWSIKLDNGDVRDRLLAGFTWSF